jgi:hypothetical protein
VPSANHVDQSRDGQIGFYIADVDELSSADIYVSRLSLDVFHSSHNKVTISKSSSQTTNAQDRCCAKSWKICKCKALLDTMDCCSIAGEQPNTLESHGVKPERCLIVKHLTETHVGKGTETLSGSIFKHPSCSHVVLHSQRAIFQRSLT